MVESGPVSLRFCDVVGSTAHTGNVDVASPCVEMFDKVIAVNVRGVWLSLKYAIPEIAERGRGAIITSSIAGINGSPGVSPYVTSKHAVIGMIAPIPIASTAGGDPNV